MMRRFFCLIALWLAGCGPQSVGSPAPAPPSNTGPKEATKPAEPCALEGIWRIRIVAKPAGTCEIGSDEETWELQRYSPTLYKMQRREYSVDGASVVPAF